MNGNANINEFIRSSVEIAIRNSYYFLSEGIKEFEIVALDFIDDQYNILAENEAGRIRLLALVKHPDTENLSNHTCFTIAVNTDYWTMDAMYDGSVSIHDGEIWGNTVFYGALTLEKSNAWIKDRLGVKEVE